MNRIVTVATQNILTELWSLILSLRKNGWKDIVYVYSPDDLFLPENCILKKIDAWWEKGCRKLKEKNVSALLKPHCFLDSEWQDGDNILYLDSADLIVLRNIKELFNDFEKSNKKIGAHTFVIKKVPLTQSREYDFLRKDLSEEINKKCNYVNNGVILLKINDETINFINFWKSLLDFVPKHGALDSRGLIGDQIAFNIAYRLLSDGIKYELSYKWNYRGASNVHRLKKKNGVIVDANMPIGIAHATGESGKIPNWIIKTITKYDMVQINKMIDEKKRDEKNAKINNKSNIKLYKNEINNIESSNNDGNKNILVAINTYNRPKQLKFLLKDLKRELKISSYNIIIKIYDDCSTESYDVVEQYAKANGWEYIKNKKNYGKRYFFKTINKIYEQAKKINFKYFVLLQDDMRLCSNFFEKIIKTWNGISDPKKISLNLHIDSSRKNNACWTNTKPQQKGKNIITGWIEAGNFLVTRKYFEVLGWKIPHIPDRWFQTNDPTRSTGVGYSVSKCLYNKGYHMYRSNKSFICQQAVLSQMFGTKRSNSPLWTVDFIDGNCKMKELTINESVTACIASIPQREKTLKKVIESLIQQVDNIKIFLNGYLDIPKFLISDKIEIATSQQYGDLGDVGKFFWFDKLKGYILTCDDDFIYPDDYVYRIIERMKVYSNRSIVSFHGSFFPRPLRNDYFKERRVIHWALPLKKDREVHIIGTGLAAYHDTTIDLSLDDFEYNNMADIWVAKKAKEKNVRLIVAAHENNWLKYLKPSGETIYNQTRKNPKEIFEMTKDISQKQIK